MKQGDIYLIEGFVREQYVHVGNKYNGDESGLYADEYLFDGDFCRVSTKEFDGSLEEARLVERKEELPVYSLYGAGKASVADVAVTLNKLDVGGLVKRMYKTSVQQVCRRARLEITGVKEKYGVDLEQKMSAEQLSNLLKCLAGERVKRIDFSVFSEMTALRSAWETSPESICGNLKWAQMIISFNYLSELGGTNG